MSIYKNVLITGASSGLGRALAILYAKSAENIFLCGRNFENLQQTKNLCLKNLCLAKNIHSDFVANIHLKILDVKDQFASYNWIEEIEQNHALDLVIANAGISAGTALGSESHTQVSEIFQTNIMGAINIIQPAIEKMIKRNSKTNSTKNYGHIAIISSLAGFVTLPSSPSYSASKVAVRFYGNALRLSLEESGVGVSVVCPGYIKTPMTAVNNFKMPFLMEVDKASKIIFNGLENKRAQIIFPRALYYAISLLNWLPNFCQDFILKKLPKKSQLNYELNKNQ